MITEQKVNSSFIDSIRYDSDELELTISFVKGETITYEDVPLSIYNSLLMSNSKGRYYYTYIRDSYSWY
jgi:hypothetical protein